MSAHRRADPGQTSGTGVAVIAALRASVRAWSRSARAWRQIIAAVSATSRLRDGAAIELGLRSFLDAAGFTAFTTQLRGPRSADAAARARRATAHGRGLGLPVRGRLEDLHPGARRQRDGCRPAWRSGPHGRLHLAGAAHQTVLATAVGIDVWQDFAEIVRTELVVIDDTTTVRRFHHELRCNQAYCRLAEGICSPGPAFPGRHRSSTCSPGPALQGVIAGRSRTWWCRLGEAPLRSCWTAWRPGWRRCRQAPGGWPVPTGSRGV